MKKPRGSEQIRRAYAFLVQVENEKKIFSLDELSAASGWTRQTTKANQSKKLNRFVQKVGVGYRCIGLKGITEESFTRICSQNSTVANDPDRPVLSPRVEGLIQKSRESALAAVQHYNNPTSFFRTGDYVVLMVIAYTALFHAIFERDELDYAAYDSKGQLRLWREGETMLWDLSKSIKEYANRYSSKHETKWMRGVEKNIEFILPIRGRLNTEFQYLLY